MYVYMYTYTYPNICREIQQLTIILHMYECMYHKTYTCMYLKIHIHNVIQKSRKCER